MQRFLAAACALLLGGCPSIPTAELDRYLNQFEMAKSTTQDIILIGQIYSEKDNDGSRVARETLAQRTKALEARLAAVDMIGRYNLALTRLASGTDPSSVKGTLEGLSKDLNMFSVRELSAIVKDVTPFFGVISQAVALFDNAVKAERFAESVEAAQPAMLKIIDILRQDAVDLGNIQKQHLSGLRDVERIRVRALRNRMEDLVNAFPTADAGPVLAEFNKAVAAYRTDHSRPEPLVHAPGSPRSASAQDKALMQSVLAQANAHVTAYNRIDEQITAQEAVMAEYGKTLSAMSSAFAQMSTAIREKRTVTAIAFAGNVLELRKAYLQLQEARQ